MKKDNNKDSKKKKEEETDKLKKENNELNEKIATLNETIEKLKKENEELKENDKKRKATSDANEKPSKAKKPSSSSPGKPTDVDSCVSASDSEAPEKKRRRYRFNHDNLIYMYCQVNNIKKYDDFFLEKHVNNFITFFNLASELTSKMISDQKVKILERLASEIKVQQRFIDIIKHYDGSVGAVKVKEALEKLLKEKVKGSFSQEIWPFLVYFKRTFRNSGKTTMTSFLQDKTKMTEFIEYFKLGETCSKEKPYMTVEVLQGKAALTSLKSFFPDENKTTETDGTKPEKKEKKEKKKGLYDLLLALLKLLTKALFNSK